MGHVFKSILGVAAVSALAFGFAAPAEAGCKGRNCKQERYGDEAGAYGYVTAKATFGGKTVTAPVRPGRWGEQVRTPGGSWVDCETSCEYTLRRLTVDFWDSQSNQYYVSPGYFRYDFDLDTYSLHRRRSY